MLKMNAPGVVFDLDRRSAASADSRSEKISQLGNILTIKPNAPRRFLSPIVYSELPNFNPTNQLIQPIKIIPDDHGGDSKKSTQMNNLHIINKLDPSLPEEMKMTIPRIYQSPKNPDTKKESLTRVSSVYHLPPDQNELGVCEPHIKVIPDYKDLPDFLDSEHPDEPKKEDFDISNLFKRKTLIRTQSDRRSYLTRKRFSHQYNHIKRSSSADVASGGAASSPMSRSSDEFFPFEIGNFLTIKKLIENFFNKNVNSDIIIDAIDYILKNKKTFYKKKSILLILSSKFSKKEDIFFKSKVSKHGKMIQTQTHEDTTVRSTSFGTSSEYHCTLLGCYLLLHLRRIICESDTEENIDLSTFRTYYDINIIQEIY